MTAFAYLRKSVVHGSQHTDSPVIQEQSVRALAARHGDAELQVLSDWDKSGRLGRGKRPGYDRLLRAIESGEAHAVYSYSLSRLARSVKELAALFDLCSAKGVPLRIDKDSIDTSTASGRMHAHVLAAVAQFESDVASERQKDRYAAKLANGESIATAKPYGDKDGEDAAAVLAAFHEAGSYSGAAKLLNERGVKPRNSRKRINGEESPVWWPSSVAVVVKRLEPQAPRRSTRGAKAGGSDFILAGLLRCPTCGTRLTGTRDRGGRRVRYSCRLGSVKPHRRVSVSEHFILPAVRREAAKYQPPDQRDNVGDDRKRETLEQRRLRILDMYEAGDIDRGERQRRLEKVSRELQRLDSYSVTWFVPPLSDSDWERYTPGELNAILRALFDDIRLDEAGFTPTGFQWRSEPHADYALAQLQAERGAVSRLEAGSEG